jgi:MFS transporter, FHS family, glucose/mannose:H+ symporter
VTSERSYWRDPLTWACNLGIFVFGVVLAILGAILPSLFEAVDLNPAQAGSLFLFLNLGALLVTLLSGAAFDRFGFRLILIGCSVLVGGAILIIAGAGTYPLLGAGSFVLGLGGGGLNVGTNALVSDLYPRGQAVALNRLGIFFGLGTFFIPLSIGILLGALGLGPILVLTAAVGFSPAVLFWITPFPRPKHMGGFPVREAVSLVRQPVVLAMGLLLFFQSGNEITTSGWLTTYLVERLSLTPARAALYLSGFWGALVLGRLTASWALSRIRPSTLVQIGAAAAGLFLALLLAASHAAAAFLLSCLVGFAMAFIFPTVMGEATRRFPQFSGTVIGVLLTLALTGGMLAPWIAGLLAEAFDIALVLALPVAGFFAVFCCQTLIKRRFE